MLQTQKNISRQNDPRFNPPPTARDSLLAEIASAKGRPNNRRLVYTCMSFQNAKRLIYHSIFQKRHENFLERIFSCLPVLNQLTFTSL